MNNEILNINIRATELGHHWTLKLSGRTVAGGYKPSVWAALDAANDAIAQAAEKAKRLVEGEK